MRNFKRTFSFVSLLIIAIGMAQAMPRSVQQAKKIALQHALKMGIALQPDGLTQKAVKARKIATAPGAQPTADSYYVFENGNDCGFTIGSGNDCLPEIVGYSLTGSYNMSRQPDAFVYYMRSFEEMAQRVAKGDETFEMLTISHGLTLQSRSGALLLTATVPQQVRINTLAGQCVANVALSAHQTQTVQLPAGIYIVGGKKVVVR